MPLFDIPGWSVPSEPVSEMSPNSKKRKRHSDASEPHANLDKLVEHLKTAATNDPTTSPQARSFLEKRAQKKKEKKAKAHEAKKERISLPKPLHKATHEEASTRPHKKMKSAPPADTPDAAVAEVASSSTKPASSKGKNKRTAPTRTSPKLDVDDAPSESSSGGSLTTLQKAMRDSLDGARFRLINETLYKNASERAKGIMQEDPRMFEDYHAGFRRQVQSWPTNPVNHYIATLSHYPPRTVIADLGCGDGALARALVPKSFTVLSFDLVSDGGYVVAADTCSHVPLPGSEGTEGEKSAGEGQIVDVVVCALSLMSTNWPGCIREAWRILKEGGELKVAEVTSRFTDVDRFIALLGAIGFKLKSKDDSNSHFMLFEFKKVARKWKTEKDWQAILAKGELLKPCEYKRR
ncbi:methyltransferase-domain-containing protein [Schizophyllum commune]